MTDIGGGAVSRESAGTEFHARQHHRSAADARVISRAVVSNVPYFPKKMPIVLIVALATFCLSTAFVVTGALLRGESYRPVRQVADPAEYAPIAPPVRYPDSRSRASDRLPAAANLPDPAQAAPVAAASVQPGPSIDDIVAALQQSGQAGRSVAVIGSARDVGTTLTAIALARSIARSARVVLVDLAFASPNIHVISNDPSAPGIAELVRGQPSFGDIITRDQVSRAHLVAAGQVGNDAAGLFQSQMLWGAVGALRQSYEYLVIDGGAQSEIALPPFAAAASYAILVGGETPANALAVLAGQMQAAGFAEVAVLTGPPPALEQAAAQSAA
jgi:polysaccharide biosynthesis transport protein